MPEVADRPGLRILLDENVPLGVARWLRNRQPHWDVWHVLDLGIRGGADPDVFKWAQDNECIIVSFDRDFADRRGFAAGENFGIVRLRVWPTTVEETTRALDRLFNELNPSDLEGALVIVGRSNIRVRPGGQIC